MTKDKSEMEQLYDLVNRVTERHKQWQEDFDIIVVTPMFGGSSTPGDVDEQFPIRSSSVRGHLRFWWRATRGARCENEVDLKKREAAIFGDTDQPSRVKIWVEHPEDSQKFKPQSILKKEGKKTRFTKDLSDNVYDYDYAYVLFPFRDGKTSKHNTRSQFSNNNSLLNDRNAAPYYYPNYQFKLWIKYHIESPMEGIGSDEVRTHELQRYKEEIYAALWAWINFGGIGARTRRGCGSLYCPEFSPKLGQWFKNDKDIANWFNNGLEKYKIQLLSRNEIRPWTTLTSQILLQPRKQPITCAWLQTIKAYREFRSRRPDRQKTTRRPGRSYWPEADSIRKLTGMAVQKHKKPLTISDAPEDYAFPRAVFGLPIITHFRSDSKDQRIEKHEREPYTTELKPKKKDRLASPLITKSIAVSREQGYGAVIILKQPELGELELSIADKDAKNHDNEAITRDVEKKLKDNVINDRHIYTPVVTYNHLENNPMVKEVEVYKSTGETYKSAIDAFLASKEIKRWKTSNYNNRK
ncbi:type III-B CRISPR module RAMP protein Cmr1 [Paenibacillus sp. 1001270B_150601_E10]|uniref:type III-B CRISPR module RAMP protein Cmr1 n=1 Tax=Paenibacillus sp. 1001270B_150601_E10 TaxID=2787079 RepID=UPI00189FC2D6|nr:type III-B CRISPR module RAMP protein Cmr1 [Paenibacillus sp. 1001270B_150601_E10]